MLAVTLAAMLVAFFAQRAGDAGASYTRGGVGAGLGAQRDAWRDAQEHASRGDYLSALHAMFAAVVSALGRANELDPHPAKTVGDYTRELWTRQSERAEPFTEFAIRYERAVYASLHPDRAAFESIAALARPLAASRNVAR